MMVWPKVSGALVSLQTTTQCHMQIMLLFSPVLVGNSKYLLLDTILVLMMIIESCVGLEVAITLIAETMGIHTHNMH